MASREAEFTSFAEAAAPRLLETAFLLCGNWQAAEDLTQTTLAKVFAAWNRIRSLDAAPAYARRTLLNFYFLEYRKKRLREVLSGDIWDLPERATEPKTPELRMELTAALAALPPKARAVVVLRYWEDMSIDQVAAQLGCSAGNVKSQSNRALEKLRKLLGDPDDTTSAAATSPDAADDRRREVSNG
jgi:RNA polymerase sigma-70 factor (sigma-E family)